MDNLHKFSALSRPIDPRYPTNLAIVAASLAAGVVAALVAAANDESALIAGFISAGSVFIAWAIGREIDPDHNTAAFVGAGLAFGLSFFAGMPNFFALGAVLVLTRLISRTVGPPARLIDTLAALTACGIVIFTSTWTFGLMAAAAFMMDGVLPDPHRRHFIAAALVAVMMGARLVLVEINNPQALSPMLTAAELIIIALFLVTMVRTTAVHSTNDAYNEPLSVHRVQASMGLALMAGLVMLWHGETGMMAMAPLWAILLGVALYRMIKPLLK